MLNLCVQCHEPIGVRERSDEGPGGGAIHRRCTEPARAAEAVERAAWRAYLSHVGTCDACLPEPIGCPEGKRLRREWKAADRAHFATLERPTP
ncbi:hypothetical protein ACSMX9_08930 [Streptomyces sp. LE64]|uniref:hypothetical protein n=1 Tax=Streptomyces sp. LE64 TaxID=3448653 RepID=UPI004042910D